jgi:hypothetical protein
VTVFHALQPSSPIIVKIVEPKSESLYDVMFGALSLTGALTLASVVLAVVLGAVLFWVRARANNG